MRLFISLSATLILFIALLTGCNSSEDQNNRQTSNANTTITSNSPTPIPTPSDGAKRITIDEVRAALEKNKDNVIIVDTRSKEDYERNHIKGSINIPFNEISQRANELPRDKMIVTYCA